MLSSALDFSENSRFTLLMVRPWILATLLVGYFSLFCE